MSVSRSGVISVRHRIVALLAAFSLVAYVLRMNISIAAKFMMPELGLTQIQMGQVFSAFMVGYAMFQVPWGVWQKRPANAKRVDGNPRHFEYLLTLA